MKRFGVFLAPRLVDDVERHVAHLRKLEAKGEIRDGYSESWYAAFEDTLISLQTLAERHPYAPERDAWGRDVRNALFADYRILYLVVEQQVWAMRVRHQRQAQTGSSRVPGICCGTTGPETTFRLGAPRRSPLAGWSSTVTSRDES